jgi:virginiamycin B lyase
MSRKNVSWSVPLVLFCWASLVAPASAQHFKQVNGTLTQVVAGRNEVFGFDSKFAVWRFNATKKSFLKIAGASLVKVAVGGGSVSQLDDVWGLDIDGHVFRFKYSTKTFAAQGGSLTQIVVGVGNQDNCHPYEVWGINSSDEIFRYDYCKNQFDQVGGPGGRLSQVATGGGDVWGLNSSGQIFHFNFGSQSFGQVGGTLVEIAVGVNDVWGINGDNQVFRYDPSSGGFNMQGGIVGQIAAGGDGVWAINLTNEIFRFDPGSAEWVQVGGALSSIAVGSGAGVFGVNASDHVFTFLRP